MANIDKRAYADPWFHLCLYQAITNRELVAQFDRLYGANLSMKGAPIERMVDEASGRLESDMGGFVEFVFRCIYLHTYQNDEAKEMRVEFVRRGFTLEDLIGLPPPEGGNRG